VLKCKATDVEAMLAERMAEVRERKQVCGECRGQLVFDPESGEQVCRVCGVVSEPAFAQYLPSTFRSPPKSEEPESRMVYDLHLHTLIGRDDRDAAGRPIPSNFEFHQLRRLNNSTITRNSRISNQMKAVGEIERITTKLGLSPAVAKEAQEVYHKGLSEGVIRGKSITNMAAATVMIACKVLGASFPSEELERSVPEANGRTSRRYYRLLIKEMKLRLKNTDPSTHVSGIAGRAGLSVRAERRALEILSAVGGNSALMDKRSHSLAAAALYLASHDVAERTNQLRLAFAAGVTAITIRKRSAEMSRILAETIQPKV
jgi:transcription initiation factor TFIIB